MGKRKGLRKGDGQEKEIVIGDEESLGGSNNKLHCVFLFKVLTSSGVALALSEGQSYSPTFQRGSGWFVNLIC